MLISIASCAVLPEVLTTGASVGASIYSAYKVQKVEQKLELIQQCPAWVVTFPPLSEQEIAALTRAIKEHIVAFNQKVREFCPTTE